ncbi:DNA methyltransferase [Methanogenium cariaci]|uniref:DNA methyltransferase n=1 Tax=Methanogenium cariaci TaxID=2197 RepID=UPI000ADFBCBA|nr:DNA methyltransferase [Methanogenium cariaci]
MPNGDESRRNDKYGITHVHHFYTKRNLWVLAALKDKIDKSKMHGQLGLVFQSVCATLCTKLARYNMGHRGNGPVSGTLYVASLIAETDVLKVFSGKSNDFLRAFKSLNGGNCISCSSITNVRNIDNNSVDYIFTDPPFGGGNLMYSELNFLWESWLKIFTNTKQEAIINKTQIKDLSDYKKLMLDSFKEMYRVLKPNRWITVEFHNSKASVWNAIQDALTKAGFIIAQVTVLDKKQGSFKQVTSAGAVKNDLVINAYKPPRQKFEDRFLKKAGVGLEKDFVAEHLSHLPIEPNIERTEQMLFSKMLAHYIQNGFEIRLNAPQFYNMLKDHFKLIDGYWFLDDEVSAYDEWKKEHGLQAIEEIAKGQQTLFVSDEKSMLIWLYNYLSEPKSYSEIYTASMQVISTVEDQLPELKNLLETNFISENGKYRRPESEDERSSVEIGREKELLKAFERVLEEAQTGKKKIKEVRKEAVALGFTKAYQEKRYQDILTVAKRLDKKILENNSEINDFVEIAELKVGEGI